MKGISYIDTDNSNDLIELLTETFKTDNTLVISGWIENDEEGKLNNIEDFSITTGILNTNSTAANITNISSSDLVSYVSIMNQMDDPKYNRIVVILEVSDYIINSESKLLPHINEIKHLGGKDIRVILLHDTEYSENIAFKYSSDNYFTFDGNNLIRSNEKYSRSIPTIEHIKFEDILIPGPITSHFAKFCKETNLDEYMELFDLEIARVKREQSIKLSSRYGSKGVVSDILSGDNYVKLEDDMFNRSFTVKGLDNGDIEISFNE